MLFSGEEPKLITTPMDIKPVNWYQRDNVEHMVGQLIKLQDKYNETYLKNTHINTSELKKAMESINAELKGMLTTELRRFDFK